MTRYINVKQKAFVWQQFWPEPWSRFCDVPKGKNSQRSAGHLGGWCLHFNLAKTSRKQRGNTIIVPDPNDSPNDCPTSAAMTQSVVKFFNLQL